MNYLRRVELTPDIIDVWLSLPKELPSLEFKQAKNQMSQDELCEYCVAISNEGGGHLILGVSDRRPRKVVGTGAVNDVNGMSQKLLDCLGFRVDAVEVNHPEGRVVIFVIPPRPHGEARQFRGKYLMRSGERRVAMTGDRLKKIFSEGASHADWLDEISLPYAEPEKVSELIDAAGFFELLEIPIPSTQSAVMDKLVEAGVIQRRGAFFDIPRLGAILLAKDLRFFPDVTRKAPRVVIWSGNSKGSMKKSVTGVMGYAVGFKKIVSYVMGKLPVNEVIRHTLRREQKLVPVEIVRELTANALIHQDCADTGSSAVIEIYDNRVEISNPGKPIVDVKRFIDSHKSRNQRLADLMQRFGACEELGSGIDTVILTAEAAQLPAPLFRATNERTEMVIFGPKPFSDMDRDDRIRACYQHCALKFVMRDPMDNQSLRARFKLPPSESTTVSAVITDTAKAELIKTNSASRKYAKWVPFWA